MKIPENGGGVGRWELPRKPKGIMGTETQEKVRTPKPACLLAGHVPHGLVTVPF